MAMAKEAFQFAISTCSEHSNEELFYYCSTCPQRICEKCVKGKHKEHEWTLIRNHARKVRQEGLRISEKIRKDIIPSAKSPKCNEQREEQKRKVLNMQRRMTHLIKSYTKHLLYLLDGQSPDYTGENWNIEHLLKLADFFERHVQSASDNVVVEMEEEYHDVVKQHTQSTTQRSKDMVFNEGKIDEDVIKKMFGIIIVNQEKLKATNLDTFTFGTVNTMQITSMFASSSNMAWIHENKSTLCTLVDGKGKSVDQRDFGRKFYHFILQNNDHIFSAPGLKSIIRIMDGGSQRLYSTSPLYPTGICESHDGGFLVCLVECNYPNITTNLKGEVDHIDRTGKLISKYTKDKVDQTWLFNYPHRIAQNFNLDLCVVDIRDTDKTCRVVAVTVDSKLRFTYKGGPRLGKKFFVGDIVCDSVGRIIFPDYYNDFIHVLSSDGDFLQYLLTTNDGLLGPQSITLYTDHLWVGCAAGVVKLYQLSSC